MPSVAILREITMLMEREAMFIRQTFGRDLGAPPIPRCFLRLIEAWGGLAALRSATGCDLLLLPHPWAHPSVHKWWSFFSEMTNGEEMVYAWSQEFPRFLGPGAWYWHQCFGRDDLREIECPFPTSQESESAEWVLAEGIQRPLLGSRYVRTVATAPLFRKIESQEIRTRTELPLIAEMPRISVSRIIASLPTSIQQQWFLAKRTAGTVTAHLPTGWEATYLDFWREMHAQRAVPMPQGDLRTSDTASPSDHPPAPQRVWEWCSDGGVAPVKSPLDEPSRERFAVVYGGLVGGFGTHQAVSVSTADPSVGWRFLLRAVQ